jgi:hypothetical protein
MVIGTVDDAIKLPDPVPAKAYATLARLAGFRAVRVAVFWEPGLTRPKDYDLLALQNASGAAQLTGLRLYIAVYHAGSRTTPLTEDARKEFAVFAGAVARALPYARDFIIGNEPNLNRFWLPQFNPDGSNAAAPAYLALLAATYDALKGVSTKISVIGGALAPRGNDRPGTGRDTHSPTKFLTDLGRAYRASGRTKPIMDAFAIHVYQKNSSIPPGVAHPTTRAIGVADYKKLVSLLGRAFDGTAQRGSRLPIVYGEYGVESRIPAGRTRLYSGREPVTIKPVPELTQGAYYRQAIELAFCQPNVEAIMLLHAVDEPDRDRWQSGVYYTDGTPKRSIHDVRRAIDQARRGLVNQCTGLKLRPKVSVEWLGSPTLGKLRFRLRCDIDCDYEARLESVAGRTLAGMTLGGAVAGRQVRPVFATKGLQPGSYRITLRIVAPLNPGPPVVLRSPRVRIGR